MKMYYFAIPKKGAAGFAKFTFENGIKIQLSWLEDRMFDGDALCGYAIVEEGDKEKLFNAEYKTQVKLAM